MSKDKKSNKDGIKIPKKLRKIGRKAMKLAEQPVVSEVVAAALLSAAAALRENEGSRRKAGKAGAAAVAEIGRESAKLGDSLRKLAIDMARRTLDNWDRADGGGEPPAPGARKGSKAGGKKAKAAG